MQEIEEKTVSDEDEFISLLGQALFGFGSDFAYGLVYMVNPFNAVKKKILLKIEEYLSKDSFSIFSVFKKDTVRPKTRALLNAIKADLSDVSLDIHTKEKFRNYFLNKALQLVEGRICDSSAMDSLTDIAAIVDTQNGAYVRSFSRQVSAVIAPQSRRSDSLANILGYIG